jgi:Tol biopolymer transport system component
MPYRHLIISRFVVIALLGLFLSGCNSGYKDFTTQIEKRSLTIPDGDYRGVAWLDRNTFAFRYAVTPSNSLVDYHVVVYTLGKDTLYTLPTPKDNQCQSTLDLGPLERLPNDKLGFIVECSLENPVGERDTLFAWDKASNGFQSLRVYEKQFRASSYTFSPDMLEMIQENATSYGMFNELYRIDQTGVMDRLLPNYLRLSSPSWSPSGKTIAFMGTEKYPNGDPHKFENWSDIEAVLLYPWDILIMNIDSGDIHIAVSGVRDFSELKWSPTGNLLSFNGEYEGTQGIWIFAPDKQQVIRIWPHSDSYDWSPDGDRIVVIEHSIKDGLDLSQPVIVNVSLDLQ